MANSRLSFDTRFYGILHLPNDARLAYKGDMTDEVTGIRGVHRLAGAVLLQAIEDVRVGTDAPRGGSPVDNGGSQRRAVQLPVLLPDVATRSGAGAPLGDKDYV